jgi:hypothetical protein
MHALAACLYLLLTPQFGQHALHLRFTYIAPSSSFALEHRLYLLGRFQRSAPLRELVLFVQRTFAACFSKALDRPCLAITYLDCALAAGSACYSSFFLEVCSFSTMAVVAKASCAYRTTLLIMSTPLPNMAPLAEYVAIPPIQKYYISRRVSSI